MKDASPELIVLLGSAREFFMADLYTITLLDGSIQRYTSVDVDVTWNGNVYSSKGLLLQRNQITLKRGVEVDELEIDAYPTTAAINGTGFLAALRQGALDGAQMRLDRLFFRPVQVSPTIMEGGAVTGE